MCKFQKYVSKASDVSFQWFSTKCWRDRKPRILILYSCLPAFRQFDVQTYFDNANPDPLATNTCDRRPRVNQVAACGARRAGLSQGSLKKHFVFKFTWCRRPTVHQAAAGKARRAGLFQSSSKTTLVSIKQWDRISFKRKLKLSNIQQFEISIFGVSEFQSN